MDRKDDRIIDLSYKNSFSYSDQIDDKVIIMDIKVKTQKGELIDIEMQLDHLSFFPGRTLVYNAKMLGEQLASEQTYDKIKKTIVVSIVSGRLFSNTKKFATTFRFKEIDENFKLTNLSEMHYLELDKIDIEEGRIAGREEGRTAAMSELVQKMKSMGRSVDEICELTGLSPLDLETI